MGCCVRNGLGLLLAAVFVLTLPLMTLSTAVTAVTFSRETYTNTLLRDSTLYDTLISNLLIEAVHNEELGRQHVVPGSAAVLKDVFGNLTEEDWHQINALIVPPDWLYTQLDHNIHTIFDWLETHEVPLPDLRLDMTPIRANLLGQPGHEVSNMLILSWDPCTPDEIAHLEQFLAGEGDIVLCEPPGDMLAAVSLAATKPATNAIAAWLPKDFSLYEEVAALAPVRQQDALRELNTLRYNINVFKRLNTLWYLVPLALLALIVIAAVRCAHAFFTWMGAALVAGGFASLVLPLLMMLFGLGMVGERVAKPFERVTSGRPGALLSDAAAGVFNGLLMAYVQPMLLQAGVAIVLGFIALFLAVGVFKARPAWMDADTLTLAQAQADAADTATAHRTPPPSERNPEDSGGDQT